MLRNPKVVSRIQHAMALSKPEDAEKRQHPDPNTDNRSGVPQRIATKFDTLITVRHTDDVAIETRYRVRRVVSRGTPGYQLGHYEMTGKPGARRSVFKVLVHLGEHQTPEAALAAWREDVGRTRSVGRDKTAARIEKKIRKLEGALSSETT